MLVTHHFIFSGVRIDSGDLAYLSTVVREVFDEIAKRYIANKEVYPRKLKHKAFPKGCSFEYINDFSSQNA